MILTKVLINLEKKLVYQTKIKSHLNAFVLSGVGNAYAVNQEVNTAKSLQTFVDVATNGVLNISSVQAI
jgi:uncharacterized protein YfiM (DUF2279 family)